MVFVTISPKQEAQYSYICGRLKTAVNKMHTARQTLEAIANSSFDKSFARCVYILTSESLQCENEIRSQIGSLNCGFYEESNTEDAKLLPHKNLNGIESVCSYFEEVYLKTYKKLLKDRRFSDSLKNLIQHHIQMFTSSLTQLQMFNDVKTMAN